MHPILMMVDAFQIALANAGGRLIAAFAAFAHAAAPAAVTALWQGGLIAVTLVLCLRFAPRVSAAHRFAVWAAAFAVVAALPLLPVFAHSLSASVAQAQPLRAVAAKPWFQLDSRWGFIVAALWLAASGLRAADLAFHSLRLRKLWKSATPVQVDASLHDLLAAASPRHRSVQICTTSELDRPSVIGFLAPRILIPDWLLARLTPGELEHVIQHEAEHLRRRDDWTNLLQKISLVLLPLNPALVWMERRLCREREMACDEGVVRRTRAPRAYAACLTSLAERSLKRRAEALSLGAFQRRPELVHRVHSILLRKRALHPIAARALVGVVGCGLLAASVELARCPQMVAFAPEQSASASHHLAGAQNDATALAEETASNSPERAASQAGPAEGFRMIETKAILPARRNTRSGAASQFVAASELRAMQQSAKPSAAEQRGTAGSESAHSAEPEIARLGASASAPRQVMLKAEAPAATASPAAARAAKPQFIVFTAWEQVQTISQKSRIIADYDTGASAPAASQQNTAANIRPASQPAAQITVTRLFLEVYPVTSARPVGSATAPGTAHATTSNSHPSAAAVPFDGGWLVFEL